MKDLQTLKHKKKAFSSSKQPRKQRRALYDACLHEREKRVRCHLSKELGQKLGTRTVRVRKGDKVRIMRGRFKKHEGKVVDVDVACSRISVEGVVIKKQKGKEHFVQIEPSNAMVIETERKPKSLKAGKPKAAVEKAGKL
ncbi:TPA: 50S ribosomal protein L24 [Candidatus Micrarchaeota archaeon]|nr:MAG: 50S ribosomal protein L24 [Candidatus Micrarchaeota archaeon CG1_02_51_15]HII39145.1 50S ribosomal protein L24 [Candidatus Micrarchaeota archaeon]